MNRRVDRLARDDGGKRKQETKALRREGGGIKLKSATKRERGKRR